MNRTVQCYEFEASVPAREIEDTLLLAVLAVEGLHGASRVQLEASYCFDAGRHACVVNVGSDVGRDICRIFGGFALRQFGEGTFAVSRADSTPDPTMEKIPA